MKILSEAECICTKKYGNQKYAYYLYYLKIIVKKIIMRNMNKKEKFISYFIFD